MEIKRVNVKTIACLGDSLTEGDYGVKGQRGIANLQAKNYPYFLKKLTDLKTLNYGRCGYKASNFLKYYKNEEVNLVNCELVIIMLGTNGGFSPISDTDENASFAELLDLIAADYPKAQVVLCTPPHVTENPEYSNCGHAEQVKNAVEYIRKIGEERKLPVIDVAACGKFTAETEAVMQTNDGLHFSEEGYKTLAQVILDGLKEFGIIK